jgi:hypothetical protein
VERFPQAVEQTLDEAVTRALRTLDRTVTLEWVKDSIALADEEEVLRARNRTIQAKPDDVKAFFRGQLKRRVRAEPVDAKPRKPLKTAPTDDPYGF